MIIMANKPSKYLIIAGIYVWKGKAYIPTHAQYESGIFVDIDPIYITELKPSEMIQAIKSVKEAGHKCIPDPNSREEFLKRKDPVLTATKAKSWKQLARNGASYTIGWTEKQIRIDMSCLNKKGVWEYDLGKVKLLLPDASLEQIVGIILEDIKTRPEVLQ